VAEPEPQPAGEEPALYNEPAGPMTYGTYVKHLLRWAGIRDGIGQKEELARDPREGSPPIYASDARYDPTKRDARHKSPFEFDPNICTYDASADILSRAELNHLDERDRRNDYSPSSTVHDYSSRTPRFSTPPNPRRRPQ
jgi:hypothetical protein